MQDKIKKIKILIMDVDGVLTDGRIVLGDFGSEIKLFNVHDGFGIALWRMAGYKSAIITANHSKAVKRRAKMLKIDKLYQKALDKLSVYNELKNIFNAKDEEICFIGDDIVDVPVLKRVGFSCSVPNAIEDVKPQVDYITKKQGGHGAIREIIELILKAQNRWQDITRPYNS